MFRKAAQFYLLALGLAFLITLWTGARGSHEFQVFMSAMLAWPAAALLMVAASKYRRIRAEELRQKDE